VVRAYGRGDRHTASSGSGNLLLWLLAICCRIGDGSCGPSEPPRYDSKSCMYVRDAGACSPAAECRQDALHYFHLGMKNAASNARPCLSCSAVQHQPHCESRTVTYTIRKAGLFRGRSCAGAPVTMAKTDQSSLRLCYTMAWTSLQSPRICQLLLIQAVTIHHPSIFTFNLLPKSGALPRSLPRDFELPSRSR
jgi:hypothetical protein